MTNSIRELRERAKCDPDAKFDVPFDFKKVNAFRTMPGALFNKYFARMQLFFY